LRASLLALYGNIDNIDAFIGGLAENHAPGTSLGPMLLASLEDQFTRLRDGDRFFYTGDPELGSPLITSIINLNTIRLSDIIELNTGVTGLQDNVFFAAIPEPSGVAVCAFACGTSLVLRRRVNSK